MVTDYIPEMEGAPGFGNATVCQVFDMTTALVFSEDYADPNAEVVSHEAATAWRGENVPLAANFDAIQANVFTPDCATSGCHVGAAPPLGLTLGEAIGFV